jgi:hypothetical protein
LYNNVPKLIEVQFIWTKWSSKKDDPLKEVQFKWNFIWQNKKKVTYKYRWLLKRGRFYYTVLLYSMFLQLVPITTKVVNLNPVHDEVYLIQNYVIKFVSDLWQVCGFFLVTPVSSTNKTDSQDITKILLKVELNTINPIYHI